MEKLGCKTVADLLKIDAQKLVDTAADVIAFRIFPVRDGRILLEEVPIVFCHSEMTEERPYDKTFSKIMRKMWVQFAKTGNPSLSAEISPDGKSGHGNVK